MKMVVSYLNFAFHIEIKAKSKYRTLFRFSIYQKNEMTLWVHGFFRNCFFSSVKTCLPKQAMKL